MTDPSLLAAAVRDIPDFPKPGIVFKDITPLLASPQLFRGAIDLLCGLVASQRIDKVVGIDARGFIFAGAVADRLGAGFVPVRKKGKLPWLTHGSAYTLEYGEAIVEVHQDAVAAGERVLLVDDLLATGGTAAAALKLLETLGARVVAAAFLIELTFLNGRKALHDQRVESILRY